MAYFVPSFLLLTLVSLGASSHEVPDHDQDNKISIREWVVHIPRGLEAARKFAKEKKLELLGEVISGTNEFHVRQSPYRGKRSAEEAHQIEKRILDHEDVKWAEQQSIKRRVKRDYHSPDEGITFIDPYWDKMWYLNRKDDFNMNVQESWRQGFTGKGVVVTILDDGVEKDHSDLLKNYDPLASADINDNDSDPQPRYDFSDSNRHGTRCAGQVAASPNNSLCAVGIAYNAQIGGIRMLDGQVSDAVEARSLSFNPDHVDIYSSSWGPNDDGKTVDGPGKLAYRAFKNGITRGRDGKGSIFVWASGNGGRYRDNCNCDGYATSIYTITVSSTSESGSIPWYSEACSSTIATTYSSGTTAEKQIVTTDLHNSCTVKHTGTSASAPMAAAIIALTLEANPDLTWRDVQHIIVKTARPANLRATDWLSNGLGRKFSHSYGFGLMDTAAMTKTAKNWSNVPRQEECQYHSPYHFQVIPAMGYVKFEMAVNCSHVKFLEHVVVPVHVNAGKKRGDLRIYLSSPSGTRSTLLEARPQDYSSRGFRDWPFMTVHTWGENPNGKWTIEIHNDAYSKWASDAKFFRWGLTLYGIEYDPNSEEYKRRQQQLLDQAKQEENEVRLSLRRHVTWPKEGNSSSVDEYYDENHDDQVRSGCISKTQDCTQLVKDCRMFTHHSVARLFCKCSKACKDVASALMPHKKGSTGFNLQCNFNRNLKGEKEVIVVTKKEPPIFCSFIPFFTQ